MRTLLAYASIWSHSNGDGGAWLFILSNARRSGLGVAPFRLIGHERRVHKAGDHVQPAGSCDHCGTGIAECFKIRSADGREFVVGSSCVEKTYREVNTAVPVDIRRAIAKVAKDKRAAKAQAKWEAFQPRLEAARATFAASPALFTDRPHPTPYFAEQGLTYRDYVEFSLTRGGMQGKEWAAALIEKAATA